ncbi:MAG TPA: MBL fold metallo-hydrolase [Thermoanaerobaculia bacterium]|nr:MBL fold metallo-hydrolase [Thermoanaerobaculia bacterium]
MKPAPFRLETPHLTIEGFSRAGHETCFRIRELGIALDIGRCPDFLIATPNVLISHAHLDHAAGIPFYAGQRHLQRLQGGRVIVPSETIDDFRELMRIHERLERVAYDIELVPASVDEALPLGRTHRIRAHRATHRVEARAYEVIELRHHLRPEFAGRDGREIAALRSHGATVAEDYERSLLFYTGDTDRGILEQNAALFRAEVLMIECSFVGDSHHDRAAKYRHLHFDDIAEFAGQFENELIVLTHFSRRYSPAEIVSSIRRRAPAVLLDRLRLVLPPEYQRV